MDSHDSAMNCYGNIYFVPDDTLIEDEATCLGIHGPDDFYGGVVPLPFVKSKAITHQLVDRGADRPDGWSCRFAERINSVVLPGYTAFSADDAWIAATRLLNVGLIRIKKPLAAGGKGQIIAGRLQELEEFLKTFHEAGLGAHGLVLELNLSHVTTVSVGKTTIDGLTIAYHGTQKFTKNNEAQLVYGGTDLTCVRGGWEMLDQLTVREEVRAAIFQARLYDEAMCEYPGFVASRRNYDVGQGFDGSGRWRSGVLEASWRSGGASTAELAGLAAFAKDPALSVVEVSAIKKFGKGHRAPCEACVHYQGDDPEDGPIIRYTQVTRTVRHGEAL